MAEKKDIEEARIKELNDEFDTDEWGANLLYELESLIDEFSDFIEDDCNVNWSDDKEEYESPLPLNEFADKTIALERRVINIGNIMKTKFPTMTHYHTMQINQFRDRVKDLQIKGNRWTLTRLLRDFKTFDFELKSAIKSGRPDELLSLSDKSYRDDEKMWLKANDKLGSKNFKGKVVLQELCRAGGKFMTATEMSEKTGMSESFINQGMNEILDNCSFVVVGGFVGQKRALRVPKSYLRYHVDR